MLVNTSPSNDSLPNLQFSNVSTWNWDCYTSKPASYILIIFNVASIVIPLPILIFILYHGVKQWKQNRSTFSAGMSHSDFFTYHIVMVELIGVFGCILLICHSVSEEDPNILLVGSFLSVFHWYGQTLFHLLTCLERYLAVVHPITYLSLKNKRGIRIRNSITGCLWLLCFVGTVLWMRDKFSAADSCFYIVSLLVVSYCSLSVLFVLVHPGPGAQGGERERVAQSKQRAFYTIVAILGVLVLRLAGSLVWILLFRLHLRNTCLIMASVGWSGIPSSLVSPLLFLHRAGKFVWCRNSVSTTTPQHNTITSTVTLDQACPKCGPGAICGPQRYFVWPSAEN